MVRVFLNFHTSHSYQSPYSRQRTSSLDYPPPTTPSQESPSLPLPALRICLLGGECYAFRRNKPTILKQKYSPTGSPYHSSLYKDLVETQKPAPVRSQALYDMPTYWKWSYLCWTRSLRHAYTPISSSPDTINSMLEGWEMASIFEGSCPFYCATSCWTRKGS